ncbi:Fic family protein [Prevotella jejuni]|uniref:Fic family protein n=1 Tax=Prevotella jejuni TaxID=1177574 RepID=UPI0036F1C146
MKRLVIVIGNQALSVKNMMDNLELKRRDSFLNLYLKPAINEAYIRLLYPKSPKTSSAEIPTDSERLSPI